MKEKRRTMEVSSYAMELYNSVDSESQLRPEGPGDVRPGPGYVRDMGTGGAGGADMRANYRDLGSADETSSSSSEKCERDVIVLNRCFDDIERFVARLQYTAAARKELERRRNNRKSKKKDLGDGMLSMRAKPPPDRDFVDLFQKFKLCFNLLAKLRDHIHDPNAPELVHFVFTPLALIVNASRTYFYPMDLAASVVAPLLTRDAIELLHNCLTSKENELWQSLGDAWLIPRSQWKGAVENYQPRFDDGWSPGFPVGRDREEEIGAQAAQEAKKRQLAAMKAEEEAQAHLRNKRYSRTGPQRTAYDNMGYLSHEEMQQSRFRERSPTPQSDMRDGLVGGDFSTARSDISADSIERDPERAWLEQLKARVATIVQVTYPRTGNNSKELTVERGEYLEVLDDSRKWWKVQNMSGKVGHVPNTIVTHYVPNDPQQGSSEQEDVFGNPVYSPDYHPDSPREGGMRRPPIQPAPPERIQKEMAGRKDGYEDWNQARWRRVSDVFPHGPPQLYRSHETHTVTPPVQPPPPPPPPPAPPQPPPAKEPPKARQPPIQQNPRPNDWSQRNGYSRNAPEAPIDELKEAFKTLRIRQKKLDVVQTPPVFITENSSANEVQDWLKQKLLPPQICEKLKGMDGKKLFRLTKEVCEKHFGRDEGSRLYSYITLSKNETKFNTASTSELMKILKERRRRAEKGNEGIPPEVLDFQDMLQDEIETDAPEMPPESQVQNGGIPRPTYNPLKRIAAEEATTNPNDAGGGSLRRQIEYQRLKLYGQVP
ncbi:unnamed protein product [Darwinula stevensoni]|uniref:SH3 domain-containing protein n=1 Tax=Darwinula stevensoni TaxID=69355 RepID=A0A7R8X817_9CRUS|nr:unnamed protein product [Darwinula stevensoni]CAG0887477.1 unnamed protein product [Darwinula stevensoni]